MGTYFALLELRLPIDRGIGMNYENHAFLRISSARGSNYARAFGSADLLGGQRSDLGHHRHRRWGFENSPDQPRHARLAMEGPNDLCGRGWRGQGVPGIAQTEPD